jgi:hypothetical protein
VMVKLPGSHILLSRWMPTWMRIGHYIEGIIAGFRKIDEVEWSARSSVPLDELV